MDSNKCVDDLEEGVKVAGLRAVFETDWFLHLEGKNMKTLKLQNIEDKSYRNLDEVGLVVVGLCFVLVVVVVMKWNGAATPMEDAGVVDAAPNLCEATIILDKSTRWDTYHITLRDFLANFDCSGKLSIYPFGFEDILFSEDTRQTCFAPLPSLKHLDMKIIDRKSSAMAVTNCYTRDSLNWMAPSLEILSINKINKKWSKNFNRD
uniref:uncharacterized protein LOC101308205 n=1 Tax=Fragaria vesca subsp. vesca TaxID=101020 RepID=UPI0005C865C7|nr:PREDICTED: uncharacterized protein LOC101308205 [Fragaria vesca subsp. vesca]